ncbi:MAG: MerR family transcriptional regulator [Chloroflexota bacterium]
MNTVPAEKTYTIHEVEEEMKVSAHTLRYYEKIGLLHSIQRAENGRRVYSEEDLGWIYWLRLLRESGMSIRAMKRYVEITRAGDHTMDERCAILQEHRDQLRAKIEKLQGYLERLDQKVEFYQGYKIRIEGM